MSTENKNHHLLQAILSQPEVWQCTLAMAQAEADHPKKFWQLIGKRPVIFAGCGSSYYLSMATAPIWNRFGSAPARAISAAELITYPEGYWHGDKAGILFAVSRSGKSEETCEAARYARHTLGWHTVAVTCNANTPLTEVCDESLLFAHAQEVNNFTTKSLTAMILMFDMMLALHSPDVERQRELRLLPAHATRLLARYNGLVRDFAHAGSFEEYVYLGHGPYYGIAHEVMLKTQEITRLVAAAYPSLEYMHGPCHAATASTLIVVLLSDGGSKYQLKLLPRLKKLGAQIAVVCERAVDEVTANADFVIELESGLSDYGRMLLTAPLGQLFAYHRGVAVGQSTWIETIRYR
jgi:glucosamine--fructose-6-phosphate aminotransferase (isomerizing)